MTDRPRPYELALLGWLVVSWLGCAAWVAAWASAMAAMNVKFPVVTEWVVEAARCRPHHLACWFAVALGLCFAPRLAGGSPARVRAIHLHAALVPLPLGLFAAGTAFLPITQYRSEMGCYTGWFCRVQSTYGLLAFVGLLAGAGLGASLTRQLLFLRREIRDRPVEGPLCEALAATMPAIPIGAVLGTAAGRLAPAQDPTGLLLVPPAEAFAGATMLIVWLAALMWRLQRARAVPQDEKPDLDIATGSI